MANGLFNLKQVVQAVQQGGWPAQKPPTVEYLVVAGGGGGGQNSGGGGAGGGVLQGTDPIPNGQTLLVTVGSGGAGGNGGSGNGVIGQNSVFGSIVATGGGYGGYNALPGGAGGSGGGGGAGSTSFANQFIAPGQGTANQGNAGGSGLGGGSGGQAGGGGGAGAVGLNAPVANIAGNGGGGIASAISGTVTSYAGGGGGGTYPGSSAFGYGGAGGGGNGASTASAAGTNGTNGKGGGGGGGAGGSGIGGTGGSGVVIVSYPDTYAAATTVNATASTSGSGSIYFPDAGGSGGTSAPGYIRYTGTSALAIGTTGTYEFWVYPTRFSTNHHVIDQSANGGVQIYYDSSGNLAAGVTSGAAGAAVSSSPLSLNAWTHVAVVINSGTMTIYFNGTGKTLTGTTVGYNMTSTNTVSISGYQSIVGQYGVIGYLANVRIVKGVAVYTGNFTSPTAPLQATQPAGTNISAITGTSTSLLLNGVSGAFLADSSTNSYTASSVSTSTAAPTWNQLSPFTGTGYKNRVYTWTTSGTITF